MTEPDISLYPLKENLLATNQPITDTCMATRISDRMHIIQIGIILPSKIEHDVSMMLVHYEDSSKSIASIFVFLNEGL
jgi:hypothetical protein